ncbi:MAG: hypothetical protein K2X35_14795, partial [Bryobacteraceae bacterium]|nr:hypothetical protein [Bryobacteraceae bacterium]
RFATPDPYQASGGPADPGSWNRYAYVGGDPVNNTDPEGLYTTKPPSGTDIDDPFIIDPDYWPDPGPSDPGPICTVPAIAQTLANALGAFWTSIGTCTQSGPTPNFGIGIPADTWYALMNAAGFQPAAVGAGAGAVIIGAETIGWTVVFSTTGPVIIAAGVTVATAYVIYSAWTYLKEDIKQNRDAARQVSKEPGCRSPTPRDYERAEQEMRRHKSKGETLSYEELLEIWRDILCRGTR